MKQTSLSKIQNSYSLKFKIDLVNNKKEALIVNGLGIVVMLFMGIPFFRLCYSLGKEMGNGNYIPLLLNSIVIVLGTILYIGAHEGVHGLVMKRFTDQELRYGWKWVYAYAGSLEGVFSPLEYMAIALAPLIVFGILFAFLEGALPSLKTAIYFLQLMNVSGSMGDVYVFFKVLKHAKEDLLINDTGTDMCVFEKV